MQSLEYERSFERRLGRKPLNRAWAKCEIFGGLACVWLSIRWIDGVALFDLSYTATLAVSLGLFVLGGYLAMAGSRSHLYQSANATAAFLLEAIEKQPSAPAK